MKINYNDLPNVNEYIKENKLIPNDTEKLYGSLYDELNDITYLVIDKDNTYISYSRLLNAENNVLDIDGLLVICKGEIKGE